VFFIPFGICCSIFIFSAYTPINLAISLSEFCLSVGIVLSFINSHNIKNYNLKVFAVVMGTIVLIIYTVQSEHFIFYNLSEKVRYFFTAACIAASIILNIKKRIDQKLTVPLVIWLASILLGFAEKIKIEQHIPKGIKNTVPNSLKNEAFLFMLTEYSTIKKDEHTNEMNCTLL